MPNNRTPERIRAQMSETSESEYKSLYEAERAERYAHHANATALLAYNEKLRKALGAIIAYDDCPSGELHCPASSMQDIARAALAGSK